MNHKIKIDGLSLNYYICIFLLYIVQIAFGHNGVLYSIIMIIIMIISYILFFKISFKLPKIMLYGCCYLIIIPSVIGLITGTIQDAPMAGLAIILPFVYSEVKIDDRVEKTCWIIAAIGILLHVLKPFIGVLASMNPNSLSFLMYMTLMSAIVLFQYKKNVIRLTLLAVLVYIVLKSGSRNTFVISIIVVLISLLPYKIMKKGVVFRIIYIFSLAYQVFSLSILEFAVNNNFLYRVFYEYIQQLFNKNWGIELRIDTLTRVSESLWSQDILRILFGNGKAFYHAHNGFYQMTYLYGIIGDILIYAFFVYLFEKAYKIVNYEKNPLVMGCVISLCGIFLIQGADVFLIGVKTCTFVPFFFMGIILCESKRIDQQRVNEISNDR